MSFRSVKSGWMGGFLGLVVALAGVSEGRAQTLVTEGRIDLANLFAYGKSTSPSDWGVPDDLVHEYIVRVSYDFIEGGVFSATFQDVPEHVEYGAWRNDVIQAHRQHSLVVTGLTVRTALIDARNGKVIDQETHAMTIEMGQRTAPGAGADFVASPGYRPVYRIEGSRKTDAYSKFAFDLDARRFPGRMQIAIERGVPYRMFEHAQVRLESVSGGRYRFRGIVFPPEILEGSVYMSGPSFNIDRDGFGFYHSLGGRGHEFPSYDLKVILPGI